MEFVRGGSDPGAAGRSNRSDHQPVTVNPIQSMLHGRLSLKSDMNRPNSLLRTERFNDGLSF